MTVDMQSKPPRMRLAKWVHGFGWAAAGTSVLSAGSAIVATLIGWELLDADPCVSADANPVAILTLFCALISFVVGAVTVVLAGISRLPLATGLAWVGFLGVMASSGMAAFASVGIYGWHCPTI